MTDPHENWPMTKEERIREDYYCLEKYAPQVRAFRCEKIPEKEFNKDPRLNEGWREDFRKDGFVYIVYDPNYFDMAVEISRKEARKIKADKLIKFLREPENA